MMRRYPKAPLRSRLLDGGGRLNLQVADAALEARLYREGFYRSTPAPNVVRGDGGRIYSLLRSRVGRWVGKVLCGAIAAALGALAGLSL